MHEMTSSHGPVSQAVDSKKVYTSEQDAVDALRELYRVPYGAREINVTKEVYDSFDPMEHLDLAVVRSHSECCGFNDNREYAYLEVVDGSALSRWDDAIHGYAPFQWMLGWQRPGKGLLKKMLHVVRTFYHGESLADELPAELALDNKEA